MPVFGQAAVRRCRLFEYCVAEGFILGDVSLDEEGTAITITFSQDVSSYGGLWGIEDDYLVPDDVAKAFNKSSVTIKKGTSTINYEEGFGKVTMSVESQN